MMGKSTKIKLEFKWIKLYSLSLLWIYRTLFWNVLYATFSSLNPYLALYVRIFIAISAWFNGNKVALSAEAPHLFQEIYHYLRNKPTNNPLTLLRYQSARLKTANKWISRQLRSKITFWPNANLLNWYATCPNAKKNSVKKLQKPISIKNVYKASYNVNFALRKWVTLHIKTIINALRS